MRERGSDGVDERWGGRERGRERMRERGSDGVDVGERGGDGVGEGQRK